MAITTAWLLAAAVSVAGQASSFPLDGRPHLPSNIRLCFGDSVGPWEGNTLVVDPTNFTNKTSFRGLDENLHVIERFTRTDPDTIVYQFTLDDPTAFTRPWTLELALAKAPGPLYEFACDEGNYGMFNLLKGARAEEKAESAANKKEN